MLWFFNQVAHHIMTQKCNFLYKTKIKIVVPKVCTFFFIIYETVCFVLLIIFIMRKNVDLILFHLSTFGSTRWVGHRCLLSPPPMATGGADVLQCEQSACSSTACLNGGTCQSVDAFTFVCLCPLGLSGDRCEQGQIWCLLFKSQSYSPHFQTPLCCFLLPPPLNSLCYFCSALSFIIELIIWIDNWVKERMVMEIWLIVYYIYLHPMKTIWFCYTHVSCMSHAPQPEYTPD